MILTHTPMAFNVPVRLHDVGRGPPVECSRGIVCPKSYRSLETGESESMQIRVESGDIATSPSPAVVVNLFEGVTSPGGGTGAADSALGGAISQLIAAGDIRGKEGEITVIHTMGRLPSPRVVVLGLGKASEFSLDKVRDLAAVLGRYLRKLNIREASTIAHGAGIAGLAAEACAQAIAEGTILGTYRFLRHKGKPDNDEGSLDSLTIVEHDPAKVEPLQAGVDRGIVLAEAACLARDLANEPANHLTPTEFANRAAEAARGAGVECTVYDRAWMEQQGMGSLLSVANGSVQPPKFMVLRYAGAPDSSETIALVGKGITFDSGGISIKPAQGMEEMKGDMSGGAAVVATLVAVGRLKPKVNLVGIVGATENMPSGSATKPGDVVKAMNGTTIEVVNTDAEGRLILADELSYARTLGVTRMVDIATLTGACIVALGDIASGVMTNDPAWFAELQAAAARSGEKFWQLPLFDEYKEQIKSPIADLKNTGGRNAGAITAGMFLKEFVGDTPWLHIDMAGTDTYDKEKGVYARGASGVPVRTLVNLVLSRAAAG